MNDMYQHGNSYHRCYNHTKTNTGMDLQETVLQNFRKFSLQHDYVLRKQANISTSGLSRDIESWLAYCRPENVRKVSSLSEKAFTEMDEPDIDFIVYLNREMAIRKESSVNTVNSYTRNSSLRFTTVTGAACILSKYDATKNILNIRLLSTTFHHLLTDGRCKRHTFFAKASLFPGKLQSQKTRKTQLSDHHSWREHFTFKNITKDQLKSGKIQLKFYRSSKSGLFRKGLGVSFLFLDMHVYRESNYLVLDIE